MGLPRSPLARFVDRARATGYLWDTGLRPHHDASPLALAHHFVTSLIPNAQMTLPRRRHYYSDSPLTSL